MITTTSGALVRPGPHPAPRTGGNTKYKYYEAGPHGGGGGGGPSQTEAEATAEAMRREMAKAAADAAEQRAEERQLFLDALRQVSGPGEPASASNHSYMVHAATGTPHSGPGAITIEEFLAAQKAQVWAEAVAHTQAQSDSRPPSQPPSQPPSEPPSEPPAAPAAPTAPMCSVCHEQEATAYAVHCGHLCICHDCRAGYGSERSRRDSSERFMKCPRCGAKIHGFVVPRRDAE